MESLLLRLSPCDTPEMPTGSQASRLQFSSVVINETVVGSNRVRASLDACLARRSVPNGQPLYAASHSSDTTWQPHAALLFVCHSRGEDHHGEPDADASAFARTLHVPVAGFFAGGEIGPTRWATRTDPEAARLVSGRGEPENSIIGYSCVAALLGC